MPINSCEVYITAYDSKNRTWIVTYLVKQLDSDGVPPNPIDAARELADGFLPNSMLSDNASTAQKAGTRTRARLLHSTSWRYEQTPDGNYYYSFLAVYPANSLANSTTTSASTFSSMHSEQEVSVDVTKEFSSITNPKQGMGSGGNNQQLELPQTGTVAIYTPEQLQAGIITGKDGDNPEPEKITVFNVFAHGLRHLAFLVDNDKVVAVTLDETTKIALRHFNPNIAQASDENYYG
jgi:hypothetical protein